MTLLFTLLGDDQLDRITKYGYVLGARYFKTQKIKFIKEIKEEFEHSNFRLGEDKNGTKKSTNSVAVKPD